MRLRNLSIAILAFLVLAVLLTARVAAAQEITIAAAADLQFAFQDLGARFEKETGRKVRVIYGSSGNFFAQLKNGAPFDLFFSADIDYPKRLEASGLAEAGSLYPYANGKIVLWARHESKLDLSRGLQTLVDSSVRKIAIANPEHAPYGRAAVAALKHENLYDKVSAKFVLGENISQAASFVVSGSADAGIVALSLAMSPSMKDMGEYVEIPAADYPPIEQAAVILKSAPHKETARQFLAFLKTPALQGLLRSYGFSVPSSAASER